MVEGLEPYSFLAGGGVAFEKKGALFGLGDAIVPVVIVSRLGWVVDFEAALHRKTEVWDKGRVRRWGRKVYPCFVLRAFSGPSPIV